MPRIILSLIAKLILGIVIIYLVLLLLMSRLPFAWGSPQLISKLAFIDENQLDPNIYFLGSSITNRQLMPAVFDSAVGQGHNTFNLAVDGTMPPHHFYLLENLIKIDSTIDYIFMELDGFDYMDPKHYLTTFSKYYFSPRWYFWSMTNLAMSPSITYRQKLGMALRYSRSVVEHVLKVGMRFDILKYMTQGNVYSFKALKRHKNGFMYFKTDFAESTAQLESKDKILTKTKSDFLSAHKKVKNGDALQSNAIYKYLLRQSQKKCDKLGIKLYYTINPRHSVLLSAEELLDIKSSFPEGRVIDVTDPQKYGALYDPMLRYDGDHLNGKGARLYSKLLAGLFQEIAVYSKKQIGE